MGIEFKLQENEQRKSIFIVQYNAKDSSDYTLFAMSVNNESFNAHKGFQHDYLYLNKAITEIVNGIIEDGYYVMHRIDNVYMGDFVTDVEESKNKDVYYVVYENFQDTSEISNLYMDIDFSKNYLDKRFAKYIQDSLEDVPKYHKNIIFKKIHQLRNNFNRFVGV